MNIPRLKPLTLEQELTVYSTVNSHKDKTNDELIELIIKTTMDVGKLRSEIEDNPSVLVSYTAAIEVLKFYRKAFTCEQLKEILIFRLTQFLMFFTALQDSNSIGVENNVH
jgi:hypothetical protein